MPISMNLDFYIYVHIIHKYTMCVFLKIIFQIFEMILDIEEL